MRLPPAAALVLAVSTPLPLQSQPPDSLLTAAAAAIERGRPWQATRLLADLLNTPVGHEPRVRLAASRAAAAWDGWASVARYLHNAPWLDQAENGLGHALIGRALLERGQAQAALEHTRRAVALATPEARAERLVIHARALDRSNQLDSGARTYALVAELLPDLRDWLILRAAGVTADSAARHTLLALVSDPTAKRRAAWTDALARDRAGDWRGSARIYRSVGARLAAARQLLAGDEAARKEGRDELLSLLGPNRPLEEVGETIQLFDQEFRQRTKAEEVRIARRAAAANLPERAVQGYQAAGPSLLTDRDRLSYATLLARLGRAAEALPLFDRVRGDQVGDATYQKARLLVRIGQTAAGSKILEQMPARFAADSEAAASALFLLGDLQVDQRRDDSARKLFVAAARRYPKAKYGQRAALQAGIIAVVAADWTGAEQHLAAITSQPGHAESLAASYWRGRVALALGKSESRRWFAKVLDQAPESYYAALSARRLGRQAQSWRPNGVLPAEPPPAPLRRARQLLDLGLRVEARFELDAFVAGATTPRSMLAAARHLASGHWYARSSRLAQRAASRSATSELASLLYPLPFRDLLLAGGASTRVPPSLTAGVIRQESSFDTDARSTADARGLMQVLPSVGASLVKSYGIEWDPVLLHQPDVNLDFGMRHLAEGLARLSWPERALAAYNAGVDRVERWRSIPGGEADPEIFVERIPFAETRDYVRKVLANQTVYRALYPGLP